MNDKPSWHFPPRAWGLDVIQDSSSTHFRDDPIPKLVREILQNSLDANDRDIDGPVEVEITERPIDRKIIGAAELQKHLESCLDRTKSENRRNVQSFYENALETIQPPEIRCLQIVDSGTSGLTAKHWDSLVFQEGSVEKPGNAPGGANGIGKNAVLNVSDLRTVFYSTRYVNGREGRVEKLQGKATLMGHPNPYDKNEDLQHVGFFSLAQGNPLLTTEIPDMFRLNNTGTGVFILGFNPKTEEWPTEITSAVIQNYFYAIHHKKLVVKVTDQASETVLINHETIDWLFERESNASAAYHYYRTIRDKEPIATQPTGKIGPLGVYASIGNGPRRTAYINRNGMLITDSREQKSNPIGPRGKSLWPDYTVVVTPETDRGDEWIRLTENPSHDSMSPRQCFEGRALTEAERWFRQARSKISEIIDDAAQVQKYGDTSNLSELAAMFPDEFDPEAPGNKVLKTKISNTRIPATPPGDDGPGPTPGPGPGPGPGPSPNPEPEPGPGPGPGPEPNPGPNPGPGPGPGQGRRPRITRPRFIPTTPTVATVAFTPGEDTPQQITLRLRPAGSEAGQEDPIEVIKAKIVSPPGQDATIQDGTVYLTPKSKDRIILEIETNGNLNGLAFRIS